MTDEICLPRFSIEAPCGPDPTGRGMRSLQNARSIKSWLAAPGRVYALDDNDDKQHYEQNNYNIAVSHAACLECIDF